MWLTILGGVGARPDPDAGCSGYLLEHNEFRLLIDPGYATFQPLLRHLAAESVDAVLISHGHPDHCADLSPLLRARVLSPVRHPALDVYAPPGAIDPVLALEPNPASYRSGHTVIELAPDRAVAIGPFSITCRRLPHSVPNLGFRVSTGGRVLTYTGDCGPCPELVDLAADADLLLAESSFVAEVPESLDPTHLNTALHVGRAAADAGVGRLVLTHLMPDTPPADAVKAAGKAYTGEITVARLATVHRI